MNKLHKSIKLATFHFSNICMNIDEYIDMTFSVSEFQPFLDMAVEDTQLAKGLFCRLLGANIWVSNIALDGHIRVSNREEPSVQNESDWSPNLRLEDFDKLLELKAFW